MPNNNSNNLIKILFLSANPTDASRLRLGQEVRDIREKLQLSEFRDRFLLESRESVRLGDISQAIFDVKPQIVHFAGHGQSTGELCFEDPSGKVQPVKPDALAALFELLAEQVNCVVLNACCSEIQAKAIVRHIHYVVGMSKEIEDKAAITFAVGFYKALGANQTIEKAFKYAYVELKIIGITEYCTPILLKKRNRRNTCTTIDNDNLSEVARKNTCKIKQEQIDTVQIVTALKEISKEEKTTDEKRYGYAIAGSVDRVNLPKLKAIVALLQKMTGDTSIEIVDIEKGSIKLILEGSQKGLEQIEALFKLGQLKNVMGVLVEDVKFVDTITLDNDRDTITNKKRLAFTITGNIAQSDIAKLKAALVVDNIQEEALKATNGQLLGTVLAVQANFYQVQLDTTDAEKHRHGDVESSSFPSSLRPSILLCTRRTRLKKIGQQVMVGDRVVVEEPDWAGGRGAIIEVLPRESKLARPAIANVNQILLVFAVADPPLEPYLLSRFLVKAESTGLDFVLCLNKSDLISKEEQVEIHERLVNWGYQPIFMSVSQGTNIEQLASFLRDKITVLAGPSGVGKSSLINALIPNAHLRVGEVSGKLARGRHTTRHIELFELPRGGLLADTPGFNQPDLDSTPEELASYFPEARQRLAGASCHFSNCLHQDESGCVVRGDWERYKHYLKFLHSVIAHQTQLSQRAVNHNLSSVEPNNSNLLYLEHKTYTNQDGNTVIVLIPTGRLDITTAWQFRLKLQEAISKLSRHVVVNLGQVNFIDSSGLTSLVAGMRDADKVKGSFRICNVHPEAKLVFEVTMMDTVFEIFETEEEALEAENAPSLFRRKLI